MHCQLCQVDGSSNHDSTSEHRAARELVATAVGRLSNHVAASDESEAVAENNVAERDKTVKTPAVVGFCESCNVVMPINEHSAHFRKRDHAAALLGEQAFETLVHAYVGEVVKPEPADLADDGAFVDETEAVNTYTCHFCDMQVPRVFKSEHDNGTRHRSCRKLTLAASRRARDSISGRSDVCKDDRELAKGTGRLMRKLLKMYGGVEDKSENIEAETQPDVQKETEPKPHRLTPKQYFTDILPLLPYAGPFYTLIIDDTEYVTIQINNETLKIHVNNLNGLWNFEANGAYYMNCRLCDGFSRTCYNSLEQQDKCHVMSLGHIKNVLSVIDNVHLIRKIDETHSICGLCNMHMPSHLVDNHVLRDNRHTMALSEALQRGKDYKESEENLKIRIFMAPAPKQNVFMRPNQFSDNQTRWNFGVPQQPRQVAGSLFGSTQNTGFGNTQSAFGNAQNTGFGNTQSVFGNAQNTGFGNTQSVFGNAQNTGFGNTQSVFGNAQNTGFGSTQSAFAWPQNAGFGSKQITFGNAQNTRFGSTQSAFGTPQNTGFGSTQSTFGNSQNTGFGNTRTTFGNAQNTGFGSPRIIFGNGRNIKSNFVCQEVLPSCTRGVACVNTQNSGFGSAQNNSFGSTQHATAFGAAQNINVSAQSQTQASASINSASIHQNRPAVWSNAVPFDNSPASATSLGVQKKNTIFGNAQENTAILGAPQTAQNTAALFGNAKILIKTAVKATQQMDKSTNDCNNSESDLGSSKPWNQSNSGNLQSHKDNPEIEQEIKNFGETQNGSKKVVIAQINKPRPTTIQPPIKQFINHSSSSSDSD